MSNENKSIEKKTLKNLYEKMMDHSYLHDSQANAFFSLFNDLKDRIPLHTLLALESKITEDVFTKYHVDIISMINNRIMDEFEICCSKIPVYKLLQIESWHQSGRIQLFEINICSIINERITQFNELLQNSFNGHDLLTRESFDKWFKELEVDKFIKFASLDLLANLAKEIPYNNSNYEKVVECLISIINADETIRIFIGKIAVNDARYDRAIEILKKNITKNLSDFDTKFKIRTYLKTTLSRMIISTYKDDSIDKPECDPIVNEIYNLITVSLLIFTVIRVKPHMKIIFWHQNSYYTLPGAIKKIDHFRFLKDYLQDSLGFLFDLVTEKMTTYLNQIDESEDFDFGYDDKPSDVILPQFDSFKVELDKLFVDIYTEPIYKLQRERFIETKVADVVLINFFEKENHSLLADNDIRDLISNWNTRIKKELKAILQNRRTINLM